MLLRPSLLATNSVVPEPQKGSKTVAGNEGSGIDIILEKQKIKVSIDPMF